ncbi:MAG: amidohydrolase family protein, partial [Planctomycetota bacterium]
DRILWASDCYWPNCAGRYPEWFRFLETEDEFFAPVSAGASEGWMLYGVGLPDEALRKVYGGNAARLLGLAL